MVDKVPPDLSADTIRLASIRRDLARLCRKRGTRNSEFTYSRPCQWQAVKTLVPGTDDFFTDDGAWQFVADLLDAGQPFKEVPLKKPPGKTGYVMEVELEGRRPLYIKLQLGSGQVWGRSFHDSIAHKEYE